MISLLRGTLYWTGPDSIILDVNGVGYEVVIHTRALTDLPSIGAPLLVHTYLQVLDNDLKLYGFLNREELELFKILTGISGMGARGALNILAVLTPAQFCQAISSRDEQRLMKVPGVGKKTAQRLVFELKDKLGSQIGMELDSGSNLDVMEETMEALQSLGYQRSEVYPVLLELKTRGELSERAEENIKQILRQKAALMK